MEIGVALVWGHLSKGLHLLQVQVRMVRIRRGACPILSRMFGKIACTARRVPSKICTRLDLNGHELHGTGACIHSTGAFLHPPAFSDHLFEEGEFGHRDVFPSAHWAYRFAFKQARGVEMVVASLDELHTFSNLEGIQANGAARFYLIQGFEDLGERCSPGIIGHCSN